MKAYRNTTIPPLYSDIQYGLVRCFIEAGQRGDETGTHTEYSYHHINVNKKAGYGAVVSAIIHSEYSIDAEISLGKDKTYKLNKKTDKEHSGYLSFCEKAKIVAHAILGDYSEDVLQTLIVADLDEIAEALDVELVYPNYSGALKSVKIQKIEDRIQESE